MDVIDPYLRRMEFLDEAERLLGEVRVRGDSRESPREAFDRHRLMLNQARDHLESAKALCAAA